MAEPARSGRAADAVAFHPVDGGAVLFDPGRRRLYALNVAAGLTWLCVLEGLSEVQSAGVLAETLGLDPATACRWAARSFDAFGAFGLLSDTRSIEEDNDGAGPDEPVLPPPRPVRSSAAAYRLFDHVVAVEAPSAVLGLLDTLLGDLRVEVPPGSVAATLDILQAADGGWEVAFGSERIQHCDTTRLIAEIERLLVQAIVPATPHLLGLHTGLMTRGDGQTVLLAGPSGAGKTTLSAALARGGWGLGTDELVLVGRDGALHPLPFPPCIKSDNFALIESWFPHLAEAPTHQRYGRQVKWLRIEPRRPGPSRPYVVFLRRAPAERAHIRRLAGFVGLERLLQQCIFVSGAFRVDQIGHVLEWHATLHYFELRYSDCDDAVSLLAGLDAGRHPGVGASLADEPGDTEGAGPQDGPLNVLALLQNLRPRQALGMTKTRIGRDHDGGYVMLDDFVGIAAVYSIGIGDDASWDKDLASRGIPVFQYDHTIDALPQSDPLFAWRPVALVAETSGQPGEATLGEMLTHNGHEACTDLILKIDIEGAEWDVLATLSPGCLLQFRQIVAEFHGIHAASASDTYKKLQMILNKVRLQHEIVHLHGNNYGNILLFNECELPDIIEITFARRKNYRFSKAEEFYSHEFDRSNSLEGQDIALDNLYE